MLSKSQIGRQSSPGATIRPKESAIFFGVSDISYLEENEYDRHRF